MDYSNLLNKYQIDYDKLIQFGFKKDKDGYLLNIDSNNKDFSFFIKINDTDFTINVIDKSFNDLYLPFEVKNSKNTIVSALNLEIEPIIENIVNDCFDSIYMKDKVLGYCHEKYGSVPDKPFSDDNVSQVVRVPITKKWYALFITIPYKSLKIKGDGLCDIVTIKTSPETGSKVIDNKLIFKAYHMSKKHWISIILDKRTNLELVKTLIDESYALVSKTK